LSAVLPGVLALAAVAPAGGGCASIWAVSEVISDKPSLETDQEDGGIPVAGVTERVAVRGVLATEGLQLGCQVTQKGTELRYHVATRYGTSWKVLTALAFVAESGIVALNFYEGVKSPGQWAGVTWMSADALGTGILFFVPEHRVFERAPHEETVTVRDTCPSGLALEVAGRPLPLDAEGRADEPGQKAVDEQMAARVPALRLRLAGYTADLPISPANRCTWARRRAPAYAPGLCANPADASDTGVVDGGLDVAVGTATGIPPEVKAAPP
jgi:hypothetical protein